MVLLWVLVTSLSTIYDLHYNAGLTQTSWNALIGQVGAPVYLTCGQDDLKAVHAGSTLTICARHTTM